MLDPSKNTLDKNGILRIDFLFSYWIFAWFFLFYFVDKNTNMGKWIHTHLNPALALWFALIENIFTMGYVLFSHFSLDYFFKMTIVILLAKVTPLYLIRKYPIHWRNDIFGFLILFGLYNLYLFTNDTNVIEVYRRTLQSFKEGKNETPLFSFLKRFQ